MLVFERQLLCFRTHQYTDGIVNGRGFDKKKMRVSTRIHWSERSYLPACGRPACRQNPKQFPLHSSAPKPQVRQRRPALTASARSLASSSAGAASRLATSPCTLSIGFRRVARLFFSATTSTLSATPRKRSIKLRHILQNAYIILTEQVYLRWGLRVCLRPFSPTPPFCFR